jgi:tellurite resistance protein
MSKIIRTPTRADGGITEEEREKMAAHVKLWTKRAFRTEPIEPDVISSAIRGIYAAADKKCKRIIIVDSPLVMAMAGGFASAIWCLRKSNRYSIDTATDNATRNATRDYSRAVCDAIRDALDEETYEVTSDTTLPATDVTTWDATHNAINAATHNATNNATFAICAAISNATGIAISNETLAAACAATDNATDFYKIALSIFSNKKDARFGLECTERWALMYQGGNMWASAECYITAARDILGLQFPQYEQYAAWEQAAIHGGFRIVHDEFCIVSNFPEHIKVDAENRPHCETGASHRWRDGWELYHWHGVAIPKEWVTEKKPTAQEAITWPNIEQRRAACELLGWKNILEQLQVVSIDKDDDEEIGELLEAYIPGSGTEQFLKVKCGTGREFCIPVPRDMRTALEANAWTYNLLAENYMPEVRT